jgi:hypothetical protein
VWDYRQLAQFNWIWQDGTTFLPYSVETAYLAGVLGDGDAVSVQSVLKVMENLSPNAHKSFYLLAALQGQLLNGAEHASDFSGFTCVFFGYSIEGICLRAHHLLLAQAFCFPATSTYAFRTLRRRMTTSCATFSPSLSTTSC